MFKRLGRKAWLLIPTGMVCSWLVLSLVLPAVHEAAFSYKADVVAQHVVDHLWHAREVAKLRSQNQVVYFNRDADEYVAPMMKDGEVQQEFVNLAQWPYQASLVAADFGGKSSVTFNVWGAADAAGELVIDVAGYRRRIVLEPTLGRTTIEHLEQDL